MAVAFDAQSSTDTTANGATSFTNSTNLTVGSGASRALLVGICWSTLTAPTSVSITWNGVALSLVSNSSGGIGASAGANTAIYGLLNPASGTNTLAGSWTGARDYGVGGIAYTGVDQAAFATSFTGFHATGTTGDSTVTVTSAVGDACVACFANGAGAYSALTGTTVFNDGTISLITAAACRDVGAASVVMTATITGGANNWAASGVDVKAVSDVLNAQILM